MRFLQRCCELLSWRAWRRRHCYRRQWDHVRQLDDYLLRDIGFDPDQVRRDWKSLQRPCHRRGTMPSEPVPTKAVSIEIHSTKTMPNGRPCLRDMA